jgi:NTP pyrophosphatase (non-canonical NTP hydrolase)
MSENNITLKKVQEETDKIIKELGGYWPPLAMLASITEEVGELAREINAIEKIKKKKPTEKEGSIGEELADTLYSLICVANYYHIDMSTAFLQVLNKYRTRDQKRF